MIQMKHMKAKKKCYKLGTIFREEMISQKDLYCKTEHCLKGQHRKVIRNRGYFKTARLVLLHL
ncbi:MAG: hypothetical protein CBC48_14045 [bacterium TMED88]|nr:MAG: hypothetical protein CBC48_14045 [bacterium TMED88]